MITSNQFFIISHSKHLKLISQKIPLMGFQCSSVLSRSGKP
jgi:hypothetical protein